MAQITDLKNHPHDFVTVEEVADYMKISKRHVQREIEKGILPARKFGNRYRVLITDLQLRIGSTDAHPSMTLRDK
jgi:excisionase family DNA binding protein